MNKIGNNSKTATLSHSSWFELLLWRASSWKRDRKRMKLRMIPVSGEKSPYVPNDIEKHDVVAKPRKSIYVDETSEPSMTPTNKHFTMAAIVTDDDSKQQGIVDTFPTDFPGEYKFCIVRELNPAKCGMVIDEMWILVLKYTSKAWKNNQKPIIGNHFWYMPKLCSI